MSLSACVCLCVSACFCVCKAHLLMAIQLVLNSCHVLHTFGQFMIYIAVCCSVSCYHFGHTRMHLWTIPCFPLCCSRLRWCLLPPLFGHACICILSAFSLGQVHVATRPGNSTRCHCYLATASHREAG